MEESGRKACPFCAENIAAAAIKCKHCGEMLIDRGPSSEKSTSSGSPSGSVASDEEIHAAVQELSTSRTDYYERTFREIRDNSEAFKATWNWYAFLFGAFWYLCSGLYVKAGIILLVCIVAGGIPAPFFWAYCGVAGNYDLYLKKVKGKDLW